MSWFNKVDKEKHEEGPFGLDEREQRQRQIFVSTFSMLAKLAGIDGTFSQEEVNEVNRFMKDVLELNEARRQFAITVFKQARESETSFEEYAKQYKDLLASEPRMYEWLVDILLRISFADQKCLVSEEKLCHTAANIFEISDERYRQLRSNYEESADDDYRLLGCTPGDSLETVKENFHKLLEEYDPDRIVEAGLPEEFLQLAKQRCESLRTAFETIEVRLSSDTSSGQE